MDNRSITVETIVRASLARVWEAWNTPADVERWNAASADWHTTASSIDLREGGRFASRMEARDGSMGFDFGGTYVRIQPQRLLEYRLDDDRAVRIDFIDNGDGTVTVRERFDAEGTLPPEQQRAGWQAILDNFRRHVEDAGASA